MNGDPYAGLAVLAPPNDPRPGYALTPDQDAAEVAAGRIPAQHVRIDPQTWQRVPVGGDPYAGIANADPNSDPGMPAYEDAGRSLVTGMEKGVAGLGGMLGDAQNAIGNGIENAGAWALSRLGVVPDEQAFRRQLAAGGSDDFARLNGAATSADTNRAMQTVAGPYHTPQTTLGSYAQTLGEFAPAAAMGGGGVLPRALNVAVPALASETAGQLTKGSALEPYARLAGGLAGGFGAGAARTIAQAPEAALGNAGAASLTPEQVAQVQALRQGAAARGLDITVPEAVQQVTNNATGLGRMQRVLESTRQGQKITGGYFAQRPAQVQGAVNSYLDTLAKEPINPSVIGTNAQEAARGGLENINAGINAQAKPYYNALKSQEMDPEQFGEVMANQAYAQAHASFRANPILNGEYAHLPDNNLGVVNEVVKHLDTLGAQAGAPGNTQNLNLARLYGQGRSLAADLASDASDGVSGINGMENTGDWANARNLVAALKQTQLDPLKAGPLGTIERTSELPAQTNALYPSTNVPEGAPNETAAAIRVLGPDMGAQLTRQRLAMALDNSLRENQPGPNQWAGSKFAVQTAGSPNQAATLQAGIQALPDGAAEAQDFGDLIQALQATGKRQQPGSMTAFNEADLHDYGMSPLVRAGKSIDFARPLEWLGETAQALNYRRNIARLLQMSMVPADQTADVLASAQAAAARSADNPLARALLSASPATRDKR